MWRAAAEIAAFPEPLIIRTAKNAPDTGKLGFCGASNGRFLVQNEFMLIGYCSLDRFMALACWLCPTSDPTLGILRQGVELSEHLHRIYGTIPAGCFGKLPPLQDL